MTWWLINDEVSEVPPGLKEALAKSAVADADGIVVIDSEDGDNIRQLTWSDLKSAVGEDGLYIGPRASRLYSGTGAPEGVVTAPQGSLYFRDAATQLNVYSKFTGAGNTGWVPQLPFLFGTTAQRPAPTAGVMYFDTTLQRPIWRSGAGWKFADGTSA